MWFNVWRWLWWRVSYPCVAILCAEWCCYRGGDHLLLYLILNCILKFKNIYNPHIYPWGDNIRFLFSYDGITKLILQKHVALGITNNYMALFSLAITILQSVLMFRFTYLDFKLDTDTDEVLYLMHNGYKWNILLSQICYTYVMQEKNW